MIVLLVAILAVVIAIKAEGCVGALIVSLLAVGVGAAVYDFNPFTVMVDNYKIILASIVPYLALGVGFARYKYRLYVQEHLKNDPKCIARLKPSYHSQQIAAWITWWPFEIISYLISDALINLGQWAYRQTAKIFDSVYTKESAKISDKTEA